MDTQPIDKAAFAFVGHWRITEMETWVAKKISAYRNRFPSYSELVQP